MNRKEAILEAALKLLAEQGVHATPMSAIAKEAGTGMGTIYNYFPNKDILINALYVSIKHQEKAVFVAPNDKDPFRTQFEQYYVGAVQFFIDNPLYFKFIEQLQASPIITAESRASGLEAVASVTELIESGKKGRIVKDIDTQELMQFIGGTIVCYLRWYFQETKSEKPSLANQLKMTWDAIKQ